METTDNPRLIGYGDSLWPVRNRTDMELHTKVQWEERYGLCLKEGAKGVLMHSSLYASYFGSNMYMYYPIEETTYSGKRRTKGIQEFYELHDVQEKGDAEYIRWRYAALTRDPSKDRGCRMYPDILYDIDPARVLCVKLEKELGGWFVRDRRCGLMKFDFLSRSFGKVQCLDMLFPDGSRRDVEELLLDSPNDELYYGTIYVDDHPLPDFPVESLSCLLESVREIKAIYESESAKIVASFRKSAAR